MLRFVLFLFALIHWPGGLSGQIYQPVFPGLSGQVLLDSLVKQYKPGIVLDYANARDTLYARVLAKDDDSLRCIYSGHTLYLDPTQDPTQYIYLNGGPLGMNTEHAYPQSKGAAAGNPRSDMHHLYPARIPVNEARGDNPYTEIPDAQTQQWFINAQVFFSIPAQNKDRYSEAKTGMFEPRESVKGDLARAIFYFYTMYKAEADAADPNYFPSQRATLCQWQYQDPADSAELTKTLRIAPYQENKANPYILDCTLARRAFCPELSAQCAVTRTIDRPVDDLELQFWPNPYDGSGYLTVQLPYEGFADVTLYSVYGVPLFQWRHKKIIDERVQLEFDMPQLSEPGLGLIEVSIVNDYRQVRKIVPIVIR